MVLLFKRFFLCCLFVRLVDSAKCYDFGFKFSIIFLNFFFLKKRIEYNKYLNNKH